MKPIIFDVDGVLLNWEYGFLKYLWDVHKVRCNGPNPTSWDLTDWTGLDKDTVFARIQDFNRSVWFRDLYELTDASVFINGMRQHKMFTVSCYNSNGDSLNNRTYNLHRKFGHVFDAMFSLPLRESKHHVLQNLYEREGPCYWIEDNHSNAYVGREVGHICFVLRRPHNRDEEAKHKSITNLTWVDNFNQIRELIEKDAS